MLFRVDNRILVKDREKSYLTASADASTTANQVLTLRAVDTNAWADNDYVIVGEIGAKNAELMRISASVSDGTALTVSRSTTSGADTNGLRYNHAVNEPVYRIDFNRIEFNRNTTDTSAGVSVLATNEIQPDDIFTRNEDTTNTTGFGFVRFNNEETSTFSPYSDGIPYTGQSAKALAKIRSKVRTLLREDDSETVEPFVTDAEIDEAINDKQRDIGHERMWGFFETELSLSRVANQFAYDLPTTIKDDQVYTISVDTEPQAKINRDFWNQLHWKTDTSSDTQTHANVWAGQMKLYPRPSSAAATTAINDGAGISATATSVTVDSSASFQRGDYFRFLIESEVIYATASTTTTFTGLLRAQEGTTAVTHADDVTITERDIVFTGQTEPVDLVDVNDETVIPEPLVLAYGAAADLALKLQRDVLHDRLNLKYEAGMENLRQRYTVKFTGTFNVVKDSRETTKSSGVIRNVNEFPRSVNQ